MAVGTENPTLDEKLTDTSDIPPEEEKDLMFTPRDAEKKGDSKDADDKLKAAYDVRDLDDEDKDETDGAEARTGADTKGERKEGKRDDTSPSTPPKDEAKIDASLLAQAETLGLNREEAEEFGENRLKRVVDLMAAKETAAQKQEQKDTAEADDTTEQGGAETEGNKAEPIALDEDLLAPEIVTAIRALEGRLDKLQTENADLREGAEYRDKIAYTERFDAYCTGDEADGYKDMLGTTPYAELSATQSEYRHRKTVDECMEFMAAQRQSNDETPLSERDLFKRALRMAFPEQTEKIVREQLVGKVKKQKGTINPRPTHRRGTDTRSRRQKAVDVISRLMKTKGMSPEPEDTPLHPGI